MMTTILALELIPDGEAEHWGGKATNLGKLMRIGVGVPPGFCIGATALDRAITEAGIDREIGSIASSLNYEDFADVETKSRCIRELIEQIAIPPDIEEGIRTSYNALVSESNRYVAVRSSVAVRGTLISSFPGMMDTYHYVLGQDEVIEKVRECWASLWSARAVHLRHHRSIPHTQAIIAPVVQLMVNADSAGVLFTANPITKDRSECIIEANWGIGESVVSGRSMTDSFVLDKGTCREKQRAIAAKNLMVVMDDGQGRGRKEIPVPADRMKEPSLSGDKLIELCEAGRRIEEHFDAPVDVEWAYQHGKLFILQARNIRNLETP
ncbi:MAG: hypothetical protein EPO23_00695 [Xanthobacteraceae bacterium]|nr:MAG: hypothetical protein EPO23_00695 [Xanthobacteraceae bacterium]